MSIEIIRSGALQLAIILRADTAEAGTRFYTQTDAPLQLGTIRRPAGHTIAAHSHNLGVRTITETHEMIHVQSGTLRVNLFSGSEQVAARDLGRGDTILLTGGAHGFEFVTECQLIEIKQGPYLGDQDKTWR